MRAFVLVSLLLLSYGTAAAAPPLDAKHRDVMRPVHGFINAFNRGDARTALIACAKPVSIIDEFPPYAWSGSAGCADWAAAYDVHAKNEGITDGFVTIGEPTHVTISGDRAYVVTHATYRWKAHGKAASEQAARLTIALRSIGGQWLMTAWTWSNA